MDDHAAKPLTGHIGVCAVLVDMLIDKGIISQSEVFDRFRRAHSAADRRPSGWAAARELADIVAYLRADDPSAVQLDRSALVGETVLLVEGESTVARELQEALERAGAEVLVARNAAEALPRIAQFDFSAAVVAWRPDTREQRTLVKWLREDGVRFLFRAPQLPEDRVMASGLPVLLESAPAHEVVSSLARLTAAVTAQCNAGAA
jgi:CheY-like chemotaxis protein